MQHVEACRTWHLLCLEVQLRFKRDSCNCRLHAVNDFMQERKQEILQDFQVQAKEMVRVWRNMKQEMQFWKPLPKADKLKDMVEEPQSSGFGQALQSQLKERIAELESHQQEWEKKVFEGKVEWIHVEDMESFEVFLQWLKNY